MRRLSPIAPPLRVVLVEPLIPPNTGNVARLCAVTGSELHLVGPLGFSIADRDLRRAGLDYWDKVHVATWASFDELYQRNPGARLHLLTARAQKSLFEASFRPGDWLVFGKETTGLDPALLDRFPDAQIAVPMVDDVRSLNLSTCAGIVVYEALRQIIGD